MTTRREILVLRNRIAPPLTAFGQRNQQSCARGLAVLPLGSDPGLVLLREGLSELGYVEGKSLLIVARFANDDFTRCPARRGAGGRACRRHRLAGSLGVFHEISPVAHTGVIGLTLNLAAARALGLNVPQSILVRADKVIQ